jgi:hypothetical protein
MVALAGYLAFCFDRYSEHSEANRNKAPIDVPPYFVTNYSCCDAADRYIPEKSWVYCFLVEGHAFHCPSIAILGHSRHDQFDFA